MWASGFWANGFWANGFWYGLAQEQASGGVLQREAFRLLYNIRRKIEQEKLITKHQEKKLEAVLEKLSLPVHNVTLLSTPQINRAAIVDQMQADIDAALVKYNEAQAQIALQRQQEIIRKNNEVLLLLLQ